MMETRDRLHMLPREQASLEADLAEEVEELWQTRPIRASRKQVADEVEFGLYFIRSVIIDVVIDGLRRFAAGAGDALSRGRLAGFAAGAALCLLDRRRSRWQPQRHHRCHAADAGDAAPHGPPDLPGRDPLALPAFDAGHRIRGRVPGPAGGCQRRGRSDRRLPRGALSAADGHHSRAGWKATAIVPAAICSRICCWRKTACDSIAGYARPRALVQRLIRKVRLFGLHLTPLEVREDAGLHASALDEILGYYGIVEAYQALSEAEKQRLLSNEIRNRRPLFPSDISIFSEATQSIIRTWRMISQVHQQYDSIVIDTVIASMSRQPSDHPDHACSSPAKSASTAPCSWCRSSETDRRPAQRPRHHDPAIRQSGVS